MEKIYIRGGQPLAGVVAVGGSKNDSVAIMAGALLVPGKTILRNVPRIRDVETLLEIFRHLGVASRFREDGALEIDATELSTTETAHDLVRQMRASFNVLGALLARYGHAEVAMPGGCDIGARPVNFHIKGLQHLGCRLRLEHGIYFGEVKRFVGANLSLEFPSAGATQHLMIAACRARGRTVIENCAVEPEIVNLAEFLNACGAHIRGAGTSTITIEGVEELHPTEFNVLPDRLQAGTYAVAAAITGGDVLIRHAVAAHSRPVLAKLQEAGIEVETAGDGIRVRRVLPRIRPTDIKTMPHPGFPTDMQQPFAALLTLAEGVSMITETVYESRFRYTTELEKLGADIRVEGRTAKITGVERLTGAPVTCTDLRGGAAVVVAALAAEGETEISGLEHLDRGYENLVAQLRGLGAHILRSSEKRAAGGLRVCSA
ncbi:MAG TPA: UDP-N-acetylglucosamine 1-carboxyvinyltransferase [Chthonomonadaceae bacterium]|nr:UDP-N-acetylglucosamine 1-carboxyvinyltransferase [Chthonomonadaceae bacterium]